MAVTDWIANLFQSEDARGLSGGAAGAVALDDSNPYYNYRLRRHTADGDLVREPNLLWHTSAYVKRRGGLGVHIASTKGEEGVAGFTDVLLILSQVDYKRAVEEGGDSWLADAMRALTEHFDDYCRREGFSRLFEHRPLNFRILCDGSADMGGQALGLDNGEFITGLLPNLYTGPVHGSRPVIGVHVNLPGIWEGYQEVGRLYNDQILFTLGSHWLDNFHHPSLREAALYRLQQYPDGSFVHIVNPDLQDRYQVTSTDQGGASVLTLATREGDPLAYIVLAVIDDADVEEEETQTVQRPNIDLPQAPDGKLYTIPPPMLIEDEPAPTKSVGKGKNLAKAKTIIPEAVDERIFTLQERGALLQKVHFGAFMLGYDVYVGQRGEMGTDIEDPAAIFQVRKRAVSFVSNVEGARVGGTEIPPGEEIELERDVLIEVAGQRLEYRDLRTERADGWPYVGEIRRPASSNYMMWGSAYEVGRSRECRVVLPDEPRNDNIHWKPSVGDGATIRARTGEIPKSRFYTDSIMVASEHAAIDLAADIPVARCTARHCYVYVRRGDDVLALFPTSSGKEPLETSLQPGDEILVGNCLFHVGFTPTDAGVAPAPAPEVALSADALVDAVDKPRWYELDAPTSPEPTEAEPAEAEPSDPPSAVDIPRAAPEPLPVENVGFDSILGVDSAFARAPVDEYEDDADAVTAPAAPIPGAGDRAPEPRRRVALYDDDDEDEGEETVTGDRLGAPGRFEDGEFDLPNFGGESTPPATDTFDSESDEPAEAPPAFAEEPPPFAEEPPPFAEEPPPFAEEPPPAPVEAPLADEVPPPLPVATPVEAPPVVEAPPAPKAPEAPAPAPAAASPAPADEPAPAAPADESPPQADGGAFGAVAVIHDDDAQFELAREIQLVQVGWMVKGEMRCGNHAKADLILPENKLAADQTFEARDYFTLSSRGRRAELVLHSKSEILVDGEDAASDSYSDPEAHVLDVIRRDDQGEEDFAVRLKLGADKSLPDPRASFLEIDIEDPLTAALLTRGLPTGTPRHLQLYGISMSLLENDGVVTVSGYLDSYKTSGGYRPFFVQHGENKYRTAPEDGADFTLEPGDRILVGHAIYEVVQQR